MIARRLDSLSPALIAVLVATTWTNSPIILFVVFAMTAAIFSFFYIVMLVPKTAYNKNSTEGYILVNKSVFDNLDRKDNQSTTDRIYHDE
jgi:hypothetical protein